MQPGRINSLLLKLLAQAFEELHQHIRLGGDMPCPKLRMITYQAELHASDYPESIKIYNNRKKELDRKYFTNQDISVQEHLERFGAVLNLFKRIGSFRLKERNPYPEQQEPDDYSITSFDYDISGVDPSIPLVKKLIDFYYDELRKEFEKKSDKSRRNAADERGKRAYVFYEKYREYEKSGFDMRRIGEIFGLTDEEQEILDYWIEEVLPHGLATSLFAKAGSGKSNLATFIIQAILIMRPAWDIITTLPLIFSPLMNGSDHFPEYNIGRIHFVKSSGELLLEEAKIGLQDRIPAVILDEFDTALISTQMRSEAGTNLKDYMFVERHYDVQGPMLIYHVRGDIPVPMRNNIISYDVFMVTLYYNRITRRNKYVLSNPDRDRMAIQFGRKGKERYLPIPRSSLPYYNQGTSTFNLMDVNMQWFNTHLTGTKRDALRKILKMVPEREWEKANETSKKEKDKPPDKNGNK